MESVSQFFSNVFSLAVCAYSIFIMYRIFVKAGFAGWRAIVPGYNIWTLCELVWGPGCGAKMFLFLIPVYGIIFYFKTSTRLAKAFGKSTGFGVGIFFLGVVFLSILAFDDSQYQGPQGDL